MKRRRKIIFVLIGSLITLVAIATALTLVGLQNKITRRLERGWVLPPLELYSRGIPLERGRKFPRAEIERELRGRNLREGRDFTFGDGPACAARAGVSLDTDPDARCWWLRQPAIVVTWDAAEWVRDVLVDGRPADRVPLFPRLITQFFDGQPILQQNTSLGQVPLACLNAVTAIEDREFLDHRGVSATGTLRALLRNLRQRRWAEGGSTITQQLVKNFFLNAKKTLRRKFEEQLLAVLLESQIGKDQILEMYLNVIYMGQSGPYQIRGFGSAAQTYFGRPIEDLDLAECAMLAALINSPGRYSPFERADAARQRRELVLAKMRAERMITEAEFNAARAAPLPQATDRGPAVHAPYFVTQALREFQSWDLDADEGVRLFTSLDPDVQTALTEAVNHVLPEVERRGRTSTDQRLQVAALTIDLDAAEIVGLVGGRESRASQFNRATDARRQVGSIIKPFVYYPALEHDGPLTEVLDEPFEWTIGRQTWRPRNFDKISRGPVPYALALAESLNVPAARVGRSVGLDAIARAIAGAGIRAEVPRLPSLTLGAFELSLIEIAQGYATLGRFGRVEAVHALNRIENLKGESLFTRESLSSEGLNPVTTAVLVGMMRQTFDLGTARRARAAGLTDDYAGKTGTTNDGRDAWFIGFDGKLLTAVWVGYDDNTPLNLTGAGAALPIWIDVTKRLRRVFAARAFGWPAGSEEREVPRADLVARFPNLTRIPERVRLVFATE